MLSIITSRPTVNAIEACNKKVLFPYVILVCNFVYALVIWSLHLYHRPLNPVGAFSRKPELRVENDETRGRQLCTSVQPPDVVFDWPRTDCRKSDDDPKHMAPRFRRPAAAGDDDQPSKEPPPLLPPPLECCRPPIRKARLRQFVFYSVSLCIYLVGT